MQIKVKQLTQLWLDIRAYTQNSASFLESRSNISSKHLKSQLFISVVMHKQKFTIFIITIIDFISLNSFQIASTKQFADFIRILQFMQPFIVRISFLNISRFDEDGDSFIDFNELKRMMEKLGEAQTHITLKQILKMVSFQSI